MVERALAVAVAGGAEVVSGAGAGAEAGVEAEDAATSVMVR